MKELPIYAKIYILATIAAGALLTAWQFSNLDFQDLGVYALAGLTSLAQVLKVEGPPARITMSAGCFTASASCSTAPRPPCL